MVKAAYVHIPFCEHICYYCDFNKFLIKNQPVNEYVDALENEINFYNNKLKVSKPETIYVGGGTPTALEVPAFERMIALVSNQLKGEKTTEFTIEINPENMSEEKFRIMKQKEVNRLSIGVQTFQDKLLEDIGRMHRVADVEQTVEMARNMGFDNISIDLMFGLPGQSLADLHQSIQKAMALDPEHISIYSLQVEPRTIFYNRMKKGKLKLPGEDIKQICSNTLLIHLMIMAIASMRSVILRNLDMKADITSIIGTMIFIMDLVLVPMVILIIGEQSMQGLSVPISV